MLILLVVLASHSPALGEKAAGDLDLVDIAQVDKSIRVDVRYATNDNFTGEPLPGYAVGKVFLRRDVAQALGRVQARLSKGRCRLLVLDGYRPIEAVAAMVRWAKRAARDDLIEQGYIATQSRHSLGIAVDVTLVDSTTGHPLDMGTAFDHFTEASHTANAKGAVHERRQALVQAMAAEGFANYAKEWWHFSFVGQKSPESKKSKR